jgi:sec-independent protein translocase protein TatA
MGISIWQLLIILVIVIILFGTKRLRGLGGDLGGAIKSFRTAVKDGEGDGDDTAKENLEQDDGDIIDAEVSTKENEKS